MISAFRKFDEANFRSLLQEISSAEMNSGASELVLDFSGIQRLDANALRALEEFSVLAEHQKTRVVLRGVNVDVYKVLTLVKLTSTFSFIS